MCKKALGIWGISSAGRAPRLHRGGQRFDPAMLHHMNSKGHKSFFIFVKGSVKQKENNKKGL